MILTGDFGGNFAGAGPLIVDVNSTIQAQNSLGGSMGPVSGAGTYAATNSSGLAHTHFRVGTLSVTNNATARVTINGGDSGASRVGTITINSGGKLDLNDNDLVATATPVSTVQSLIASGRNGGGVERIWHHLRRGAERRAEEQNAWPAQWCGIHQRRRNVVRQLYDRSHRRRREVHLVRRHGFQRLGQLR